MMKFLKTINVATNEDTAIIIRKLENWFQEKRINTAVDNNTLYFHRDIVYLKRHVIDYILSSFDKGQVTLNKKDGEVELLFEVDMKRFAFIIVLLCFLGLVLLLTAQNELATIFFVLVFIKIIKFSILPKVLADSLVLDY